MLKIKSFLQEAKQEFGRINWPTRKETIKMISIVFAISLIIAFFLGFLDFGFLVGIKSLV